MTQHGTPASAMPHPSWCDPDACTLANARPYRSHQSESHVVPADPPVTLVAELHLASTMPGFSPEVLLLLEFGMDDDATVIPLTLHQAHQLHVALDKLLATAAA
jgi:fructoselysine-6-P-deglycase FrlB-like protein